MANKIELTAQQLASLELVIAQKQQDPQFSQDWADAVNQVGRDALAAVAVAAAVFAVAGAQTTISDTSIRQALAVAKSTSLDKLLEIRKNAIRKG